MASPAPAMMHPQPMPQMMPYGQQAYYSSHHPHKIVASKGWHITKLVFGSTALVLNIIAIGLAAGLMINYFDTISPWIVLICTCAAGGAGLTWQIAEFITVCVRKDRGIHPGAHVAVHLLIWLAYVAGITISAILFANDITCSSSYCRRYNYLPNTLEGFATYIAIFRATLVFMGFALAIHFFLFVRYCVECDKRNKSRPQVVMVANASGGPNVFYMPPQQLPQNQTAHMSYMPMPPPQAHFMPAAQPTPPPGDHTSMYSAYPPQTETHQGFKEHDHPDPSKYSELHNASPVPASGVSTVSTDTPVTQAHNNTHTYYGPNSQNNA